MLFVEPDVLLLAVTEPLLVCVTVVVLVLLEVAAPVVTLEVECPVFEPELVFDAVPPELPTTLPAELSAWRLPPLADASAACELPLLPLTPENDRLNPVFEIACWLVPTHELCDTFRFALLELSTPPPSPAMLFVEPLESLDAVTPPLLPWLTLDVDVFVELAAPDDTLELDVPSFVPVLSFDASPPMLPTLSPALLPV
jgi:hypothetical protein